MGVVTIATLVCVALHYRARWPMAVLVVSLLGAVSALLVGRASPALGLACEIAVFTDACLRPRRVAGIAARASAAVLFGAARSGVSVPITSAGTLIVVVWTALAFAGGVAVRTPDVLCQRARRTLTRANDLRARSKGPDLHLSGLASGWHRSIVDVDRRRPLHRCGESVQAFLWGQAT